MPPSQNVVIVGPRMFASPTGDGVTTIGARKSRIPPRTRNEASATIQLAGLGRTTRSDATSPAPQLMAPGSPRAPRAAAGPSPTSSISSPYVARSPARKRRLRQLVSAGSRTRSAPGRRRTAASLRGPGTRTAARSVPGSARASDRATHPGPAAASRRHPPPPPAGDAGRRRASAPDDLARRGNDDPLEFGNAEPVDCR